MCDGRLRDNALLDGQQPSPNSVSAVWANFLASVGNPDVTFHALRHPRVSQPIDAGVDIVAISRRLGHAKPDITLRIYALFGKDDGRAAAAINDALAHPNNAHGANSEFVLSESIG